MDYVLQDWQIAGLRLPSAFKPALFTLEPALVRYHVGALSAKDLAEIDQRLKMAIDL